MAESEKSTETYLVSQVEALGGACWKWVSPNTRGVMDRICFLPGGIIFFVEVKSEGGDLQDHQARRARDLTKLGQRCYMADTKARVDEIIKGEWHEQETPEGPVGKCNERGTEERKIPAFWLR